MKDDGLKIIDEKRWKKKETRIRKKRDRRKHAIRYLATRPYISSVLNLFTPKKYDPKKLIKSGPKNFIAPRIFHISRNPAECLKYLKAIVEYARTVRRPRIILDQRKIEMVGLGADSVLGVILTEIKKELRATYGAYIRGMKPKSKSIQKMMDEVGSVRTLFMDIEDDIRLSISGNSSVYRHRHLPSQATDIRDGADTTSRVITDFSDHLDDCLSFFGKRLSVGGRDRLCHYAGEILDNAKEHSGLNDWVIVGHVDLTERVPIYRCAVFSFGRSIAKSFQDLPMGSYPLSVIEPYMARHQKMALFSSGWREEDLLTVIALQGDISSKNMAPDDDRGQGTVELINFFQDVFTECGFRNESAEMSIISGATKIRFDGRYRMAYRPDLNRDVIAFNLANNLFERPDPSAVICLNDSVFPGVLINIEMPLVGDFMEQIELTEQTNHEK